jgi:hypothetical protein
MKANKKSSEKVLPEAGVHIAILTQILDWGTVTDSFGSRRKCEFIFELPESLHTFNEERGEEPLIVDRKFALTIGKGSALKEAIEGMLGVEIEEDEFELEELLGTVCQLQIKISKGGDYDNVEITSYMQLSKNDQKRIKSFKAHGDLKMLDLENFDEEVFKSLPEWKQKKIALSPEFKALAVAAPAPKAKTPPPVGKAASAPAKKTGKVFKR